MSLRLQALALHKVVVLPNALLNGKQKEKNNPEHYS
jgi:hypothetical protein